MAYFVRLFPIINYYMGIDEIIRSRRSYYPAQYSGGKLSDDDVGRLLENANWAPSHFHTEPWRFKVFKDGGTNRLMDELARLYKTLTPPEKFSEVKLEKYGRRADKVSHVIAIVMRRSDLANLPETEEISAVSCAVQNLWLTLTAIPEAVGYWSTGNLIYTEEFAQFLNLNQDERCLGLFYIGMLKKDAIKPSVKKKPIADKTEWITS